MKRPRTAPRAEPRRWRTPPPITRTADAFEGMEVIREVPGEAGVLLWQAYRNVMYWASVPVGERKAIFAAGAGDKRRREIKGAELPRGVIQPLKDLAGVLDDPEGAPVEGISAACRAVTDWASEHEHSDTALAFAQAAALAAGRDAAAAHLVGRMSRLRGDNARADTWYRHAVMVARQVGDWPAYVKAYLGLGKIAIARGNLPLAQRMLIKGLRAARRKGLGELQGAVLHDLFVVATQSGRTEQALDYARGAFRHYGADNADVPRLTHDVAYMWLEQGHFARAASVFKALAPTTEDPVLSILAFANLTRAAGNLGDEDLFHRAWTEASRRLRAAPRNQTSAASMLEMGLGAAALGDTTRATEALQRSISDAREIGAGTIRLRAESALDALSAERRVEGRPAASSTPEQERTADLLADRMVRSLTGRRPSRR